MSAEATFFHKILSISSNLNYNISIRISHYYFRNISCCKTMKTINKYILNYESNFTRPNTIDSHNRLFN